MLRVFFDMDGTLIDTYKDYDGKIDTFLEKGFFQNLEAKTYLGKSDNLRQFFADLTDLYQMMEVPVEFHILTAVATEHGQREKLMSIGEYMGKIFKEENIHFTAPGQSKAEYARDLLGMLTPDDVLVDDYGKNLCAWHKMGGKIVKIYPVTVKLREWDWCPNLEGFIHIFGGLLFDYQQRHPLEG